MTLLQTAGPLVDEWELKPGEQIRPGLSVLRMLGGGNRYQAYLAHDERRLCTVVAKLLRPSCAGDGQKLASLRREFGFLKMLDHPVIARGFDLSTGTMPHLTVEYVEGPRLSTLLRRYGNLPIDQLLPLALQLGAALHYMHKIGVAHLDVKPQNVIMSGPPRLIDLSIAHTLDEAAELTVPVGTTGYMSPEQKDPSGPARVGAGADIWGMAATLHVAATGRLPDQAAPTSRRGRRLEPELPNELQRLLAQCLAHAPGERPSAQQLVEGLEPLVARMSRRFVLTPPRPGSIRRR